MLTPSIASLWLGLLAGCAGTTEPPPPEPQPAPAAAEPFEYEPAPELHPVQVPTEPLESFALSEQIPAGFPDLRTTGATQFALHTMEGRYDLTQVRRAKGTADVSEVFVLDHAELPNPKKAKRVLKVIQAPLPFPMRADEVTFRPEDLRVFVGNEEIPFAKSNAPNAKIVMRFSRMPVILHAVELGMGVTILPECIARLSNLDKVVLKDIEGSGPPIQYHLIYNPNFTSVKKEEAISLLQAELQRRMGERVGYRDLMAQPQISPQRQVAANKA